VQEEAGAALRKTQEEMKRYIDRKRKEMEEWKKGDKVMLSTKDLVFKERPVRKLVERYVGPYEIEEVVSTNAVKLRLPSLMRIYPVVNISQIIRYKKQVKGQKREEGKPVWEKEEDLKNAKELVDDFEGRVEAEIRCQEKVVEKKREKNEYRRMELLGKYTVKLLYGWDDKRFEDEYLKKLEKNWKR